MFLVLCWSLLHPKWVWLNCKAPTNTGTACLPTESKARRTTQKRGRLPFASAPCWLSELRLKSSRSRRSARIERREANVYPRRKSGLTVHFRLIKRLKRRREKPAPARMACPGLHRLPPSLDRGCNTRPLLWSCLWRT